MTMNDKKVIAATDYWIRSLVVHYGLCPFAAKVMEFEQLHFELSEADNSDDLIKDFLVLAQRLLDMGRQEMETALLIHPYVLTDFSDYNNFLSVIDAVLEEASLSGVLQVASFHPDYLFAGAAEDDAGNFSNRSPFPMLHLLREESISEAIEQWQDRELDISAVPNNNIILLESIGTDELRKQLDNCLNPSL